MLNKSDNQFEGHLHELKTMLTSKLRLISIGSTLEQTNIPVELSHRRKQLLIMFRSFYDEISELASSDEIIKMGGIKSSQILCYDEFSKEGLLSTLSKLEEKIKESHYQEPVCFILGCLSKNGAHAINVNYDPSDDAWQWMDINLPIQKPFKLYPLNAGSSHEAFWEDLSYFKRYDYFSISAILPKKKHHNLRKYFINNKKI